MLMGVDARECFVADAMAGLDRGLAHASVGRGLGLNLPSLPLSAYLGGGATRLMKSVRLWSFELIAWGQSKTSWGLAARAYRFYAQSGDSNAACRSPAEDVLSRHHIRLSSGAYLNGAKWRLGSRHPCR